MVKSLTDAIWPRILIRVGDNFKVVLIDELRSSDTDVDLGGVVIPANVCREAAVELEKWAMGFGLRTRKEYFLSYDAATRCPRPCGAILPSTTPSSPYRKLCSPQSSYLFPSSTLSTFSNISSNHATSLVWTGTIQSGSICSMAQAISSPDAWPEAW